MYLAFTAFLAPATRLIPETTAAIAGSGSWLSPIIALPFVLLYVLFLSQFFKNRRLGEGSAEMILRAVGGRSGRTILFFIGCYMFFYSGFLLRTGTARFTTTIYSESGTAAFIVTGLVLGAIAALGPMKAVIRSAKVFGLFCAAVEIFVLLLSLRGVDPLRLLPVFDPDPAALILGAAPAVHVLVGTLCFVGFAIYGAGTERGFVRSFGLWSAICSVLLTLVSAAIVGSYGAELTASLVHPFFTLTRGISLLNTLERVEAFIVAVWIFPDFIMLGLMLSCGCRCLRLSFGYKPPTDCEKMLSLKNGRWLIIPGIGICIAAVLLIPSGTQGMKLFGEAVIPALSSFIAVIVLPLCCLIGKLRKTI